MSPPSRPIPTIQPLPFTADDYGDFRLLGSRMEHHGIPNNFVGPISTRDSTARPLVSPENAAVNIGAPPGSASRAPVVSPMSTIGATELPPSGLISSRTRHRAASTTGAPRPTADYGFERRPKSTVSRRPKSTRRPPTPPAGAQLRLPPTTTPPAAAPTPPASPAPTAPRPVPPSTTSPTSPSTPTLLLPDPAVDLYNDPHLLARVECYTYRDWAREQRAEPVCYAAIRFLSFDSPPPPPADLFDSIPSAQRPLLSDVLALAAKADSTALTAKQPSWFNDRPHLNPGTASRHPHPIPPASTFQC